MAVSAATVSAPDYAARYREGCYTCPVSLETMLNPVKLEPCGHYFEKDSFAQWISSQMQRGRSREEAKTCPLDRRKVTKWKESADLKREIEAAARARSDLFGKRSAEEVLNDPEHSVVIARRAETRDPSIKIARMLREAEELQSRIERMATASYQKVSADGSLQKCLVRYIHYRGSAVKRIAREVVPDMDVIRFNLTRLTTLHLLDANSDEDTMIPMIWYRRKIGQFSVDISDTAIEIIEKVSEPDARDPRIFTPIAGRENLYRCGDEEFIFMGDLMIRPEEYTCTRRFYDFVMSFLA